MFYCFVEKSPALGAAFIPEIGHMISMQWLKLKSEIGSIARRYIQYNDLLFPLYSFTYLITGRSGLSLRNANSIRCNTVGILNPIPFKFPNLILNLVYTIRAKLCKKIMFFTVFQPCWKLVEYLLSNHAGSNLLCYFASYKIPPPPHRVMRRM